MYLILNVIFIAMVESLEYFRCIAMSLGKDTLSVLVMPCSKTNYLCAMNSQKHATIKIFDTEDDEKH